MNRKQLVRIKVDNKEYNIKFEDMVIAHVLVAISKHPMCQVLIQKEYEMNRNEFKITSEKYPYPYRNLFDFFPAVESYHMEKLAIMYMHSNQDDEFLMRFIKQGYNRVIQFVERNDSIQTEAFIDFHKSRESAYVSESELQYMNTLLFFVTWMKKKEINNSSTFKITVQNLGMNIVSDIESIQSPLLEDEIEKRKGMKKFEELFGAKIKKQQALDSLITIMEKNAFALLSPSEKKKALQGDTSVVYSKGIYRHFKSMSALTRLYGINDFNYLEGIQLGNNEFYAVHSVFENMVEKGRLEESDWSLFLSSSFIIKMMVDHYNTLRSSYFTQEEELDKNQALAEVNKKESMELTRERASFEKEKIALESRIKELEKQIQENARNQKKYSLEIESEKKAYEKLVLENEELKDLLFRDELEESENESEFNSDSISQLNQYKVAVIGGHQNFHSKLKETFPAIRFVSPDEKTVDLSFLLSMDAVVFITTYNNHVQYNRTKQMLEKSTIPLIMMKGQPQPSKFADIIIHSLG